MNAFRKAYDVCVVPFVAIILLVVGVVGVAVGAFTAGNVSRESKRYSLASSCTLF